MRNSSGQSKKTFVDYSFKISRPGLLDQADREAFARDHSLIRFRSILDFRGLNSVVLLSDSNLPELIILSESSSG